MTTTDRPRKKGRPSSSDSASRPAAQPTETVTIPIQAIVCPACGRGMQPRRRRGDRQADHDSTVQYLRCNSCGRALIRTITGTTDTIQPA